MNRGRYWIGITPSFTRYWISVCWKN